MIVRNVFVAAALAFASTSVWSQQLLTGVTGAECSARGGSIRTWTSSIGVQPPRGECWIPPRIGGAGAARGGGNSAAAGLGAAAGFAGALGNFLDTLNQIEADRQERDRRWEEDLRQGREQMLDQTIAREGALMQREAELREREAAGRTQTDAPNPFAANPSAAPNPFGAPPPASFKTDAQIASQCAQSGNAGMCELALKNARASDPAYQQWKAGETARLDENVRRSKAEVDRLTAARGAGGTTAPVTSPFDPGAMRPQPYNSADPDLAKCREGAIAPWTIAGCYDTQAPAAPKPREGLRDQLRRALADVKDESSPEDAAAPPAQVATVPRAEPPRETPAQTASAPRSDPWANGPWRTRDERACREAGGNLVSPKTPDDLNGIPQVVLDNPDVPRAALAATPYCVAAITNPAQTVREGHELFERSVKALEGAGGPDVQK